VLQLNFATGITASSRGLAVQTRALNIIGSGAINLRAREIELRFKTVWRGVIGIGLFGIADRSKVQIEYHGVLLDDSVEDDLSALTKKMKPLARAAVGSPGRVYRCGVATQETGFF
jgi:hypothetical protein